MLNHELRHDDGILVLNPEGPLEAADFATPANQVDAYLESHTKLHGVLIHAKSFPGWKDFGAMFAHMKLLREHIQKIEKVAIVAGGALANIMPNIANHFVHAQVQHFDFERENAAWVWLRQSGNAHIVIPLKKIINTACFRIEIFHVLRIPPGPNLSYNEGESRLTN